MEWAKRRERGAIHNTFTVVLVAEIAPNDLIGSFVDPNCDRTATQITAFRTDKEGDSSFGRIAGFPCQ
jgi:hypothetical protein